MNEKELNGIMKEKLRRGVQINHKQGRNIYLSRIIYFIFKKVLTVSLTHVNISYQVKKEKQKCQNSNRSAQ